jgi:two-component system, cell cycle sensor histidine kinase and response regulator CckA
MLREAVKASTGPDGMANLFANVARLTSQALEIPRTSIWLFDATRTSLVCRFQLPKPADPARAERLDVAAIPGYVRAVSSTEIGAIAVSDALNDPRTAELREYLQRYDVGALLDVPLIGPGALRGLLCHEHTGGPRVWQEEEIDFATDVGAMVALALEVERRVMTERALSGSEAKYQHLVESLPVVVYSFDARSGSLDYLSPRMTELGGRRAEEYLVEGGVERWVETVDAADRPALEARLSAGLADPIEAELVYRIRLPDGRRRFVRDTCAVVRDATGRAVAVQGTLADVTGLREAELERAEVERRYRALLESVDLLAVTLGRTGHVEFINESFLRLSGFTRDEALGADGFELLLPPKLREQVRADFLDGMRRGKVARRFETSVRRRDGSTRKILWTNVLIHSKDGEVTGTSSLGVDITERLESEALALQREKLESLGRLAAGIAHDFNNLLTVIVGAAEHLERGPREDREPALADIRTAVQQALELTRALLSYARRESVHPTVLSVDAVVTAALPMLTRLLRDGLALTHQLSAPDARVLVDPAQLRQILMNLVGNAVDATAGSGSTVRIATQLVVLEPDEAHARGLADGGTFVRLTVADDGPGIPEELRDVIFEPFYTTKPEGEGTGLGLATCAAIARSAGGFMTVESTFGAGACFGLFLPTLR